jgi:3-hydroxyacyl-CoA dehydrogenase/enoyl-CoA hydratase/3-hydroxybutyryl-CoA epimerase
MSPFSLTVEDGIGTLTFDLPGEKVNKFSNDTLLELTKVADELKERKDIKVLLFVSAKKDIFIAGADLKQFEPALKDTNFGRQFIQNGQNTFQKLAELPFPTVAVINGACLGGGTELALALTYRIAADSPKTLIGLPETQLGIIPGWGGTQRMPRLIGLQNGIELIVSGKPVKATKALKLGLVDALYAPEFQKEKALEFAKLVATEGGAKKAKSRRHKPGLVNWLLEGNPLGRKLLYGLSKNAILKQTKGNYPAPILALETIEKSYGLPIKEGLKVEAQAFTDNVERNTRIARYLIGIFLGQEELKKQGGYEGDLPKGVLPKNAGVIGAGTMGGGIAYLFANQSIPVRLKDINWEAIGKGISTISELLRKAAKKKKIGFNEASLRFHQLSWTLDYNGFEKSDFIVESAVENVELKQKIYADLENVIPAKSIIATNTSSLTIKELSEKLKNPDRFIGMHFFNPAPIMPLVEIVPGAATSKQALADTLELARKLGKTPVVTADCHGFLVNRVFMMGANESFYLLEEGTPIETVDKALLKFGMPLGAAELADEVGIDVTYKVAKVFEKGYGERFHVPALLQKLYDAHLYGKKIGKGFYLAKGKFNPEAISLVKSFNGHKPSDEKQVVERYLYAMINEASRCLEEKVVAKAHYVDLAMIFGTGFPPFRGGPLAYADTIGLKTIYEGLKKLEATHGARFKPTYQIEELAQRDGKFYG